MKVFSWFALLVLLALVDEPLRAQGEAGRVSFDAIRRLVESKGSPAILGEILGTEAPVARYEAIVDAKQTATIYEFRDFGLFFSTSKADATRHNLRVHVWGPMPDLPSMESEKEFKNHLDIDDKYGDEFIYKDIKMRRFKYSDNGRTGYITSASGGTQIFSIIIEHISFSAPTMDHIKHKKHIIIEKDGAYISISELKYILGMPVRANMVNNILVKQPYVTMNTRAGLVFKYDMFDVLSSAGFVYAVRLREGVPGLVAPPDKLELYKSRGTPATLYEAEGWQGASYWQEGDGLLFGFTTEGRQEANGARGTAVLYLSSYAPLLERALDCRVSAVSPSDDYVATLRAARTAGEGQRPEGPTFKELLGLVGTPADRDKINELMVKYNGKRTVDRMIRRGEEYVKIDNYSFDSFSIGVYGGKFDLLVVHQALPDWALPSPLIGGEPPKGNVAFSVSDDKLYWQRHDVTGGQRWYYAYNLDDKRTFNHLEIVSKEASPVLQDWLDFKLREYDRKYSEPWRGEAAPASPEAVSGHPTVPVEEAEVKCHVCRGSGQELCPYCGGKGLLHSPSYSRSEYCKYCGGTGKKTCGNCGGTGYE